MQYLKTSLHFVDQFLYLLLIAHLYTCLLTLSVSILLYLQNSLEITPEIKLEPIKFYSRDQTVLEIEKITKELKKLLKAPLNEIKYPIGSIDHFIDDVHILTDPKFCEKAISCFIH